MAGLGPFPLISLDFLLFAIVTVYATNGLPGLPGFSQYKGVGLAGSGTERK